VNVATKIEVTLGSLTFSGEGEQSWLAEQLDKVLQANSELAQVPAKADASSSNGGSVQVAGAFSSSMASYIKEKGGESNQVDRFLISADWLRRRGITKINTSAVSKALLENHQKRLANPADCLNKNVAKGYCEKTGKDFFITPEGLKKLGHG